MRVVALAVYMPLGWEEDLMKKGLRRWARSSITRRSTREDPRPDEEGIGREATGWKVMVKGA